MEKPLLKINLLSLVLVFFSFAAQASKVDLLFGMFSLNATSPTGDTSVGGLGSYRVAYGHSVYDKFDLALGYTVNMTNTISGELAYGLDVGINYFPFTFSSSQEFKKDSTAISMEEIWRPYVGLNFNQRQFQSIRNSYAGFGLCFGTEYMLSKRYSLKGELRYISLSGSSESEATEINTLFGLSLKI